MTQEEASSILKLGSNVFLTGPAGSGKTYLLNQYIEYLKSNNISVGVTASTGIAATHINGRTIHSWTGLNVVDKLYTRKEINKKIKRLGFNKDLAKKYVNTYVLVIDEISMLDAQYLDIINTSCQALRKSVAPFGGMQVVLCGDFFQLPPVSTPQHETIYAFKSRVWLEAGFKVCYLSEHRRYADKKFVKVLNDIRHNRVRQDTLKALQAQIDKPSNGNFRPTRLYTINKDVDAMNDIELGKINKPACAYQMKTFHKEEGHIPIKDQLVKHCMAPYKLILKVDAVVMFVKNNFDPSGKNSYVNGTLGKIVKFQIEKNIKYPVVETSDGRQIVAYPQTWVFTEANKDGKDEAVASITQIPLRLAWAITVHKSQGLSLDKAIIDLRGAFEYGMGYVALSRIRSLGGMTLLGLNQKALQVNPEITKYDIKLRKESAVDLREFNKMKKPEIKKQQKGFINRGKRKVRRDLFG